MTMPVLIVEDEQITESMLTSALASWGYAPLSVRTAEEAEDMLEADSSIRLMILDWRLPGMNGLNFCRSLRQSSDTRYIYTIVLTSRESMDDQIEALEAGADDFLRKPFDPTELRLRLRAGARIARLQEQMERTLKLVDRKASNDSLTGAPNREAVLSLLFKELARQKRHHLDLSVLTVDIDRFQEINEAHGFAVGDFVLREFCSRMMTSLRIHDSCGRIGSDTFLIVLPETSAANAINCATRLQKDLCGDPVQLDDRSVWLSCSIGVASVESESTATALSTVSLANDAMYRAKSQGGNCIRLASGAEEGACSNSDVWVCESDSCESKTRVSSSEQTGV